MACGARGWRRGRGAGTLGLALLLLALLSVSGCGGGRTAGTLEQQGGGATVIATSFYPMYIMTKNVARGIPGVHVINIARPTTGCLHDYQLTTDDLKKLQEAHIFVINGAGMESFLDKVIAQLPKLKIVEAGRGIELLRDEDGEANPHVWVSVSLARRQVENIAGQLALLDPRHAAAYRSNAAAYAKRLQALEDRMHAGLAAVGRRDIVTFHEAFPYFAREFNLRIAAVVEREPGSEPSAAELARTIAMIRETGARAIFVEPQYPVKAAETIARETGSRVYLLDPAVTGPDEYDAYIKIMEQNYNTLKEALGGK